MMRNLAVALLARTLGAGCASITASADIDCAPMPQSIARAMPRRKQRRRLFLHLSPTAQRELPRRLEIVHGR